MNLSKIVVKVVLQNITPLILAPMNNVAHVIAENIKININKILVKIAQLVNILQLLVLMIRV